MAFLPEYVKKMYEEQQNGINTDCSFVFEVLSCEDGEIEKKLIHGHKFVLSCASEYFENNLKPEWEQNQPIPITTYDISIFEKLIKSIYLVVISFEDFEEACELYEAAHFYCLEGTLRLLRDEIIDKWIRQPAYEFYDISSVVNISFKYGDEKLKHFCFKIFSENTEEIIESRDFLNYCTDAINSFYQISDLKAGEFVLMKGLENYIEENKTIKKELQPAIDAIHFQSLLFCQVDTTSLLSETEKFLLRKKFHLVYQRHIIAPNIPSKTK